MTVGIQSQTSFLAENTRMKDVYKTLRTHDQNFITTGKILSKMEEEVNELHQTLVSMNQNIEYLLKKANDTRDGSNGERAEGSRTRQEAYTPPHLSNQNYQQGAKTYKMEFPEFNGTNPEGWIRRANSFFQLNQNENVKKVLHAGYYMVDVADIWYTEYVEGKARIDWETFCEMMLHRFLSPRDEDAVIKLDVSGVEYCHRNMVVHRDLKPEKLLLDSKYKVKIANFGLSNIMRDGHFLKTSCGSPNYAAPEVISGKLYAGPEVDVWSCGVILYALLCGTLPFDDENIPNLFKKIKGGIYTLPSHLSAGARDLIPRLLIVDPMKRMTIPEIRSHPWFQAHLPRYLTVPPPDTVQQAKKIDEEILQEVTKRGFDRNMLVDSLRNRVQNEGTVAYYLLLDNRFRLSSGYLGSEFQETMESGYNRKNPSEPVTSPGGKRLLGAIDYQQFGGRQFGMDRKWALGLQSRAHPREIMTEVLKALQELNVSWKKIGHYNMKCRWSRDGQVLHQGIFNNTLDDNNCFGDGSTITQNDANITPQNVVKFEMQLYKTREDKYLLDLQRVQGAQFLFLDLCAAFLAQLRVL